MYQAGTGKPATNRLASPVPDWAPAYHHDERTPRVLIPSGKKSGSFAGGRPRAYTIGVTPETLRQLQTPAGREVLARAAALEVSVARYPACLDRLAKHAPRDLARAALDTLLLRAKARDKFESASALYFTREGYEMASGTLAARHRAGRFRGFGRVADLGSGVGGDAIELARVAPVTAFDSDPLHAAMTGANLAALGLAGQVLGDFLAADLSGFDAAFADPGRRAGNRRTLSLEAGAPPLSAIRARFPAAFPLAVKAAPGVPRPELAPLDAEAEFVSVNGELKECVLWFGPLRSAAARATLLPGGDTLVGDAGRFPDLGDIGEFVFDPDPAVTRSGLVGELAARLGAHALEPGGAFLSGGTGPTPFATRYRVDDVLPLKPRAIGEYLRSRGVGRVTPVKRGVEIDCDALAARLKLGGPGHRAVLLMRAGGVAVAAVGERA